MPDKNKIKLVLGNTVQDLKQIRLAGLDKPFEKLTISELVQLRPGSDVSDTYEVNAVTDNVSVTTSSMLEELGRIHKINAMQKVVGQARLDAIRGEMRPGGIGGLSAQPGPGPSSVSLPRPEDDVFNTDRTDPFKI